MAGKRGKYGFFLPALLAIIFITTAGVAIASVPDGVSGPNSWLNISPGSNATQLNFSWATLHADTTYIRALPDTNRYPIQEPEVQIINVSTGDTTTFFGMTSQAFCTGSAGTTVAAGWYQNKVTATKLTASTSYKYRVGYDTVWSACYTFQTRNPSTSFSFIAVGDPQIGATTSPEPAAQDSNVIGYDSAGWRNTITIARQMVPNAPFLLSAGDQIDNTSSQPGADSQYDCYFDTLLLSLPVATIDGNHDYGLGQYFGYHYNLANQSTVDGATEYGNDGDYWFTYGNALIMVLNSNTLSAATHAVFIGQAIAANPNAKWKIVSFHHSLYSDANHTADADIIFRRAAYPPVFDQYNIDVVLSGHDHSYTRSYQMLGGMPVSRPGDSVMAVNPEGTLYLTLNSGSGSKFYQLYSTYIVSGDTTYPVWTKVFWQQNEPTFSNITISSDTLSIVTYAIINNTTTKIDGYTIVKYGLSSVLPTTNNIRQLGPITARLFQGSLLVEGLEGTARLEIFNVSGVKMLDLGRRVFNGSSQEVTVARSLRSGIYLLRITGSRNDNVRLVQP
jgi:3',5'-cyclic AMP phosphodiesterase CpdA